MPPRVFELKINNDTFLCGENILDGITSVWQGDNPLNHVFPNFLLQISLASTFTATTKFLLEPFGQSSFVSQMIGGILLGPSFLGRTKFLKEEIFNERTYYIFETCQYFGCMFFLFLVGVKMDISILKKSGKKAWVIGLSCYFAPLLLTSSIVVIVKKSIQLDPIVFFSLSSTAAISSLSSFHSIASFLSDMKLLNSELGRLAMSASMITGLCSWFSAFIASSITQSSMDSSRPYTFVSILLCMCVLGLCVLLLFRPLMIWMVRQTPEDKSVKEGYILIIFLLVLVTSFFGEALGQHFLVGPVILGLAVPVGPPLGSAVEEKLECFVTCILLPMIVIATTWRIDIFKVEFGTYLVVEVLVLFSFFGKLVGAMLPALYCRMPYQDALLLGLIMNVQGVLDFQYWLRSLKFKFITKDIYGALMLSMVVVTGTISPLVRILYDPSRKYKSYKRKSMEHSKPNTELRILACIYDDDNVPAILKVLAASNPTTYSPICIYVLHMIQLQGRASPLLVAHKKNPKSSSNSNPSTHIINAFQNYEVHNYGTVYVNSFTAISPYSTMHNDICTLGLERRTTLIIVPFHYQTTLTSTSHSSAAIRKVNKNILKRAPCSVGILIDRGLRTKNTSTNVLKQSSYHVAVIFLGGADDREALAYGARMGENISIYLNVVRFIPLEKRVVRVSNEKKLDDDIINEFRVNNVGNENVMFTEELVKDGVELISAIRSIEKSFELLIVGRQHGEESLELLDGLEDWNEFPELGVIGDMLASSDSEYNGSVLVIQQQLITKSSFLDESPSFILVK